MIWARFLKVLTNAVLAVIALGAAATIGNAQNAYQGKFTLAVETRWGSATIPPGDYSFVLASNSFPYTFHLRGKDFSAIIVATTSDKLESKHSQLNLVDISDVPSALGIGRPHSSTRDTGKHVKSRLQTMRLVRRSAKTRHPFQSTLRAAREKPCQSQQNSGSENYCLRVWQGPPRRNGVAKPKMQHVPTRTAS